MELLRGQPELLRDGIDPLQIRFEPITDEAIEASQLWGKDAELYRWEDVPSWKDKDRKGFDLSLWYGFQLCGLCYATPRKSSICIKLILLEGNPDDSHPLKGEVASLALLAIDYYARMIKCTEIEVQDPEPFGCALVSRTRFRIRGGWPTCHPGQWLIRWSSNVSALRCL
ncbi:N-acetyltransferase [Pseudomonas aeruginosa]|uniref:N-acetyltransferase n=2 Tax=Pseudomonas aeruginosa TaxID=287 RepID=UPI0030F191DB